MFPLIKAAVGFNIQVGPVLLVGLLLSLPRLLQWFTASIGLHHIHHLCSRIPNYRLQECLDENPELHQVRRVTLLQSLRCARLSLWSEEAGRMIRFRDLGRIPATPEMP